MDFQTRINKRIKQRYNLGDIQLIKLSVFAATLLLVKLWPPLLEIDWYWYAALATVAAIIPLSKVYGE